MRLKKHGHGEPTPDGARDERSEGRRRHSWLGSLIAGTGVLAIAGVIALLVVGLLASRTDTAISDALAVGEAYEAPDFSLPVLANGAAIGRKDGQRLTLSRLRGRPVVLNFWASWCDPCKREAARLKSAWRRHRRSGLVMLGLDVQDLSSNAMTFIREHGQTYPSVRDKSDDAYRAYGLTGVPETFFIDRQGMVRARVVGEIFDRQLERGIAMVTTREKR